MQLTQNLRGKQAVIPYTSVLVAVAILCKIVMIVELHKYMHWQARNPSTANSPAMWPAHSVAPVHMAFEDSAHYGIRAPGSDAEWSSLAPNDGLVYLGDDRQVHSISMFHELRCLNIIRRGIVQAIDGDVTDSTHHVQHCLNYIRQMILCRSNTMLTGFVQSSGADKPHSFLNIQQCNDWTEIYKEVEMNLADHP